MNNQKSKSKPADSEQRSGKGLSVQRLVRRLLAPSVARLQERHELLIRKHGDERVEQAIKLARITPASLEDWLNMEPEWFAVHYALHFPTNT